MSEFLAEAQVKIVPDTTAFRIELERELRAATAKPVAVPVTPVVVGQAGGQVAGIAAQTTQAQAAVAAAQSTVASTATKAATATKGLTDAQKLEQRAARLLSISQEEVLNVTSSVAAAQITATRSASALAVARRANAQLTSADSAATVQAVRNTLALAEAQQLQAQASLRAAQATSAHATSMATLARGAGATGLAMLGIRGATLAANSAFLIGAGGIALLAKSLQTATSFNSEIAVLGSVTGATADEMERASEASRALGRDITLPGISAGDAANAITELSRAGLGLQDSIEGASGVLQLATAAQLSNADATELAASALNSFGLGGDQAVRVADLLANAANAAQGGIEEMGLALRQSAGVARQVGISLDDTVALLTLLARNGLQGSDAGTALRTALIRLINPTKEAKDVLRQLNVELRDQQGNIRPEVFAEFAAAQRNLSKSQQDANAAIVFGQDAIRALAILGREGTDSLRGMNDVLSVQGTAARIAAARMTGLRGSTANLTNQLGDLSLTLGEAVTPALEAAVDELAEFVAFVNDGIDAIREFEGFLDSLPGSEAAQSGFGDALKGALGNLLDPTTPINLILGREVLGQAKDTADNMASAGALLRSSIEDAARQGVQGAESFGDQIVGALNDSFRAVNDAIAAARQAARTASIGAITGLGGQQAGLEEQFNQIVAAGGSSQEQIANLRQQAARQAAIIRRAGPDAAGVVLEARREAQASLAQINQQIKSLEDGIAADAKQAADDARQRAKDIQDERDRQDRDFIDLVSGRLAKIDNRVLAAQATASLADDIAANKAKRDALTRSRQEIERTVQNAQLEAQALASLTREFIQIQNTIADLTNQQREAEQKRLQEQRDAITEQLAKRTTLAELRGDDQAQLRAINRQIADAQKRVDAAKKAKQGVLDEQIALQELINARKELIEKIKGDAEGSDATGGTTLADLFRRAEEIVSGAGNVGFSTSGLQGLRAQPRIAAEVQQRLDIVKDPAAATAARQERSVNRLIVAIDQLTAALTGNTVSGTPITRREQNQWKDLSQEQRFFFQKQAKMMVEQGLVG